ncbi:2-oxoacid dehydrogenases acyltransferase-domain-containing protein [Aspergillus pseudodeflectus]|uniref:Dihydrolipoamide acetyltransferase component of pyruvate dehydrogenase complex n=1 Tax=Aspergillus pseudodeflectus TaxID=176178 RepID=A0ABR4JZX4_9EURO
MAALACRSRGRGWALSKLGGCSLTAKPQYPRLRGYRYFHETPSQAKLQPYLLADIGEGITECRIVQWFVQPGDRVNQFDAVCEVQSDKASVEITSRYDGVIGKLHHEVDEIASVGQPLLDIDVEDSTADQGNPILEEPPAEAARDSGPNLDNDMQSESPQKKAFDVSSAENPSSAKSRARTVLAMPAARVMLKQHGIDISDVPGTGVDGRIMKEDVQRYLNDRVTPQQPTLMAAATASDVTISLTPTERQMFKVMTESLSIPHLGYTHSVDLTALDSIRQKHNARKDLASEVLGRPAPKLTFLPIIIKALSIAFQHHKKLNSNLVVSGESQKPELVLKGSHDFGIAVDTPKGLLVPVIRGVQTRSIMSIAEETNRLSDIAKQGKLKPSDLQGATFTVSNIGSIGGNAVSPIIVPPMVGILAVGKVERVARFMMDAKGDEQIVKRQEAVLSWSVDHRVLDGASVARCANLVSSILEEIDGVSLALM